MSKRQIFSLVGYGIVISMKMLIDYDEFEVGKQYCIFYSDLLRFKPDYSKLSIADLDDYVKIAWMFCTWGYVRFLDCDLDIKFNRLRKSFRICGFTRHPAPYTPGICSNTTKNKGFYQDTKNFKYFENLFSLLNARYGLIERDQIKQMKTEYEKDLNPTGTNAWKDSRRAVYSIIESVKTMDSNRTKQYFGSDETRMYYYRILTSLPPWSVFINAGISEFNGSMPS